MGDLKIIYEDNHIIVVIKPPGVISQADGKDDDDMLSKIKKYIKEEYSKPGNVYLGLVHRLDKPVGGLMVFAKTSKAASRLSEQIRTNIFEKKYLSIVNGIFQIKSGTLDGYLVKDRDKNISKLYKEDVKDSKYAILKYEVITEIDHYSMIKVYLKTGRSHQIRVQLADTGHPIVGDRKYGNDLSHYTVALWSYMICFNHPVKDERLCFTEYPESSGIWNIFGMKGI